MNTTTVGSIPTASPIGNHQPPQQSQQLSNGPQISRYLTLNGTTLERRSSGVSMGNSQVQAFGFDPVAEQEMQRQMDDFKKTITIVLWYKARLEPLRIQHTIRSFPFFELSSLTSIVHDLGLADDSYLDTYIPESDQWMQHTIHTVRIVESQQRLLYRIRKSLLEGINSEDCTGLQGELDLQMQALSSRKSGSTRVDGGLPTPMTPALGIGRKDASDKNPRKRPAPDNDDFDQGRNQSPKVHLPNSFYLVPQSDAPMAQGIPPASAPVLSSDAAVGEDTTPAGGNVENASHPVSSTTTAYIYPNLIYYAPHPSNPANASPGPSQHQHQRHHSPDTPQLHASQEMATTVVAYRPDLPIKRWPNDYSVAEISAGFHEMDRLVTQTPNLTQRVAFERVFGTRYVKSTVCRHRGVWRRASRGVRDHFIALGNSDGAAWAEFVRTVEGRQTVKNGIRNNTTVSAAAHESIEFSGGGSEAGSSGAGVVEEPIMDSLQNAGGSGSSSAESTLQNELNVFDAALSHIPNPQG